VNVNNPDDLNDKEGPPPPKRSLRISINKTKIRNPADNLIDKEKSISPPKDTEELSEESRNEPNGNHPNLDQQILPILDNKTLHLESSSTDDLQTTEPITRTECSTPTPRTPVPNDHDYFEVSQTNSDITLADSSSQTNYSLTLTPNKRVRYNCSYCAKKFLRKRELTQHEERHTNAETRPFLCKFCAKGFKTKSDVRCHEKRHGKQVTRQYVCFICMTRFITKPDLKNHERTGGCIPDADSANVTP